MALAKTKAAPAKLATGKATAKAAAKPAKATKGLAKPKTEREATFKEGQVVQFAGYKTAQKEPMFEVDQRVVIVKVGSNEDKQKVYAIVAEADKEAYDEDPEAVDGDEVFASELKKAEVVPVDPYAITVPDTERLTELLAENDNDPFKAALAAQNEINENMFYLGGLLGQLYRNREFQKHGDYEDTVIDDKVKYGTGWDRFCQENFGLGGRKGTGLINIYTQFAGIPDLDLTALSGDKRLGWVKLEKIAGVITKDNAQELLERSREQNVEAVREMVKTEYVRDTGNGDGETRATGPRIKRVTITARFFEDQAEGVNMVLKTAGDQLGYKTQEETLEHIIMQWAQDHLSETTYAKVRKASRTKRRELKGQGVDITERDAAAKALEAAISSDDEEAEEGEAAAE